MLFFKSITVAYCLMLINFNSTGDRNNLLCVLLLRKVNQYKIVHIDELWKKHNTLLRLKMKVKKTYLQSASLLLHPLCK